MLFTFVTDVLDVNGDIFLLGCAKLVSGFGAELGFLVDEDEDKSFSEE